jgi:hypothetical protein
MPAPRPCIVVQTIIFGVRKLDRIDNNSTTDSNALQTTGWYFDILWISSFSTPWTKFGKPKLRHTGEIENNKGKLS